LKASTLGIFGNSISGAAIFCVSLAAVSGFAGAAAAGATEGAAVVTNGVASGFGSESLGVFIFGPGEQVIFTNR
jgi:hypothetical protein